MKKFKIIALMLVLTLALGACGSGGKDQGGLRSSSKPFAEIGDQKITNQEFYRLYDYYAGITAVQNRIDSSVLSIIVRDIIIDKELEDKGIEISEDEYKEAIDSEIEAMGGQEQLDGFLNVVNADMDTFKEGVRKNVKFDKHREWFVSTQEFSDEELDKAFEENKDYLQYVDAKHILVDDEETAKKVIEELESGKDFAEVSDEYSTDEAAKQKGGELGKVNKMYFDKDFVNAAFDLEEGQISDPVKTQFGYHVIVVNEKHLDQDEFTDQLKEQLSQKAYSDYIQGKMDEVEVKLYDQDGKPLETPNQEGN